MRPFFLARTRVASDPKSVRYGHFDAIAALRQGVPVAAAALHVEVKGSLKCHIGK